MNCSPPGTYAYWNTKPHVLVIPDGKECWHGRVSHCIFGWHREAELAGLRADVASKGSDAQLLGDLQSQLAARELEIARLEGELLSKVGHHL